MESSLRGRRLLVTAGPTWVPLDAVRHISNSASGSLGLHLARRAAESGARVTLLLGPGRAAPTPEDRAALRIRDFVTFYDLRELVREQLRSGEFEAMVHTAAVADFQPTEVRAGKSSSGVAEWRIRLVPTPKIVDEVRRLAPGILLVKFKLEFGRSPEELARVAAASREQSDADLILVNDQALFTPERHPAMLLDRAGIVAETETREELIDTLLREIGLRLRGEVLTGAR